MTIFEKILVLSIVFITYAGYGVFTVSEAARASKYYYLIGIAMPIVGNLLWLYFVKQIPIEEAVVFGGVWDIVVSTSYLLALLIVGTPFSPMKYLGLLFFILGAIAFKY